jgi:flagellar biosynthesis component FlhA
MNRSGGARVRPKREAIHLARALVMEHTTHPLRVVMWSGVLLSLVTLVFDPGLASFSFAVLACMLALIGEYVGGLSRRLRDRPAYYVREEHTSSVLLREERRNVVGATS